jgi:hypothetical protein
LPTLRQVLPENTNCHQASALLDVDVVAVKLNTGAPCSSHAEPFESWPGEGNAVRQWFVLANGQAVGIDEASDTSPVCRITAYSALEGL